MLTLIEHNRSRIIDACQQFQVQRLSLFGSAVTDQFNEQESDIDLLVEFNGQLKPTEYSACYFGLLSHLEVLLDRDIDLLTRSSLKNPYLKASIESTQQVLFDAA